MSRRFEVCSLRDVFVLVVLCYKYRSGTHKLTICLGAGKCDTVVWSERLMEHLSYALLGSISWRDEGGLNQNREAPSGQDFSCMDGPNIG